MNNQRQPKAMTAEEQRTYWRKKQRESRARRSGKEARKAVQISEARTPVTRPYTPVKPLWET